MKYHKYSDVKVRERGGEVEWVDYGEIRTLSPESAMWLAKQLAAASVAASARGEQ